jgi:DNA-binding NarL/FixJ family response regulator
MRLIVIADDPLVRAGLTALVEREPGVNVVAELTGEEDLPRLARGTAVDVVLWDLAAAPASRLERLSQASGAGLAVLAVVHDEEDAAAALAAGARGAVARSADGPRLVAALAAVGEGLVVVDEALAAAVLRPRQPRPAALVEALTPRESEVLQLLAQGLANKAIAERLGISDHTAKFHVNAILGKLGVQTRTEAIVHAARLGLVLL